MPMYEYICLDCNNKFEELVMRCDMAVNCPQCKSANVEKLVSAFSSSSTTGGGSYSSSSSTKSSFG